MSTKPSSCSEVAGFIHDHGITGLYIVGYGFNERYPRIYGPYWSAGERLEMINTLRIDGRLGVHAVAGHLYEEESPK